MDGAIVSWKIADVLDFEWLLADDGELDQAALRSRDRALSAQVLASDQSQRARSRSEIFWAWLQARRRELSETLPGEYFLTAWQLLVVLSALTGVGLGMSVAAALLLAYTGEEPVNVGLVFRVYRRHSVADPLGLPADLVLETHHASLRKLPPSAQLARRAALVFECGVAAASR